MKGRAVEEEQGSRLWEAAGEDVPGWWPTRLSSRSGMCGAA